MAQIPQTRSDCSRCAALCCIAYPADKMPGFSASKEAGEPCPNLDACGLCRIYERRAEEGFSGCIAFECFGAGQHVVQHLFEGRDWREDPALLRPMVDTFLAMRPVSDLLFLVRHAGTLDLTENEAEDVSRIGLELAEIASSREKLGDAAAIARLEKRLREVFADVGRRAKT